MTGQTNKLVVFCLVLAPALTAWIAGNTKIYHCR